MRWLNGTGEIGWGLAEGESGGDAKRSTRTNLEEQVRLGVASAREDACRYRALA